MQSTATAPPQEALRRYRSYRGDGCSLRTAGPSLSEQSLTGAELFVHALDAEGVTTVFGHPGGAVITIYDALAQIKPRWKHVLVRHEQAATHMAEGYAKATGRVGTVLVTSGPGATNCVTGIADAFMDSIPMVVFTGQVPTHLIGGDAFQETDIVGVTRSVTKHSYQVRTVGELLPTIREAYHIAATGRPGPVVVDLPKNVLFETGRFDYPREVAVRGYAPVGRGDEAQVEKAARMIAASERPLFYVGGGVIGADATEALGALVEATQIPVTTTLHGLGSIAEDHPLALGMLGMHGTWWANQAVQHCDLLIALGARFDDRVTGKLDAWAPHAKVVHVDIDPACISKNIPVDCAILGDVREVIGQLTPLVEAKGSAANRAWREQIAAWRSECPLHFERDGKLHAQEVIERLSALTSGRCVITTDVGQHQMWAAQHYTFARTRSHITSGGLGTMGFGFPAAMGAAFGLREDAERTGEAPPVVVNISGDGGFLMNAQELGVAQKHRLPVVALVINNGYLGMVRQWQELFHGERYSETDLTDTNPDYARFAQAFGVAARRLTSPGEIDDVLTWAIAAASEGKPVLVEALVENDEMVFPMVPAGAETGAMITRRNVENAECGVRNAE
jgi:acetolactate synthase-1/2/3 large subunit